MQKLPVNDVEKRRMQLKFYSTTQFLSTRLKSLRDKDMTYERGGMRLQFTSLWFDSEIGL